MSGFHVATGQNLWLYFGVDEHPFATYFDVHQGRVLTHSHVGVKNDDIQKRGRPGIPRDENKDCA